MVAPNDSFGWFNAILAAISALAGSITGLVAGTWRVARIEPRMKLEFIRDLANVENDLRDQIEQHNRESGMRSDLLVEQFQESFAGLRRQLDEHRLHTEQKFMRKEDFRDFRDEYREDMREIKDSIKDLGKK